MPSFSTEVPHQMGQEKAVERLKGFVEKIENDFKDQVSGMQSQWNDNVLDFSFTTYGFTIDGSLTVNPDVVVLNGNLPFAAVAFRGKIEQTIRERLEKALASE